MDIHKFLICLVYELSSKYSAVYDSNEIYLYLENIFIISVVWYIYYVLKIVYLSENHSQMKSLWELSYFNECWLDIKLQQWWEIEFEVYSKSLDIIRWQKYNVSDQLKWDKDFYIE